MNSYNLYFIHKEIPLKRGKFVQGRSESLSKKAKGKFWVFFFFTSAMFMTCTVFIMVTMAIVLLGLFPVLF